MKPYRLFILLAYIYTYPDREVVRKAGAAVWEAVSCLEALNAKRVMFAILWNTIRILGEAQGILNNLRITRDSGTHKVDRDSYKRRMVGKCNVK